ncbi:hypothetical protein IAE35_05310 [Pseudomonas sp. S75]|uniref:hypothetical protein n=1 Tax=unclassified Pseudomonas TaxID=196821 RepID=UPI00190746D5|nr:MULTISPECIES: hypothetical protein [unclassified Pseudomonas]MBJ9975276.1 hypothetical protein [Pseudomonas sp. S30]MBK0152750.1 hypothetical protein [Pseudomonas sp. S75]
MANKQSDDPHQPVAVAAFRDTRFTSRQIFTADLRPLLVAVGRIEVSTSDTDAIACLERHPDFERLE